jgi:lipopolysaccharide export system permease protein
MKISPTTYAYLESYNNTINTGYHFTLEEFDGKEMKSKLKASKIVWQPDKNAWLLDQYSIRIFKNNKEYLIRGIRKDTVITLTPKDFSDRSMLYETLTLGELNDYIDQLRERGAENISVYLTEKYERYTYPFAIIILTLIGVISSSRKSREGPGYSIIICDD